ncbi:MAG: radical SAM protein [Bacteroidales bacterium]|jgi:wyosine [tRNA(Phe)-imidazoG37] synthetase (radical SAM superfamily)|nr:radical SAM protein [Bacteroidales bacterium]MBP8981920.1 radical SAM protein [Bacteroidales bacterium]NLV39354.1 radical SAM protein [Bacteroidales bacterium]HOD26227.1 radical SAM protein [Bacteroidales bacterium]HOH24070.1 radical SAM protein [Bacteroidales bacterium]
MSTMLFQDIIFGPIKSRRLGISLGINLLPLSTKFCSFDCLYCECGLGDIKNRGILPKTEQVIAALDLKLQELLAKGVVPDVLTFAGNGEPTLHPDFPAIVDAVVVLRDRVVPQAKVSVLSNSSRIDKAEIRAALLKVDNNILKLDSALESTVQWLNRPVKKTYSIRQQIEYMQLFEGKLIVQTLFLRGTFLGKIIDNTTEEEITAWIEALRKIKPLSVMIYTLDRETPVQSLEKIPLKELETIARRLRDATGIPSTVAG